MRGKYPPPGAHDWECVAPDGGFYRWQCRNCPASRPYPSEFDIKEKCPATPASQGEGECKPGCGADNGDAPTLDEGDYVRDGERQWCSVACLDAGVPLHPAAHAVESQGTT